MTKRIRQKWFVKEPTTHQYLGRYVESDNMMPEYGWFVPFVRDPLSLSEREIKAINPLYWDWREVDKSYVMEQNNATNKSARIKTGGGDN